MVPDASLRILVTEGKAVKAGVNCVEISCLENNRKGQLKKYPTTLYLFLSNKFIFIVIPESTLTRSIKLLRKLREFSKILLSAPVSKNLFQLMVDGVTLEAGLTVLHRVEEELEHGSEPAIILPLLTVEKIAMEKTLRPRIVTLMTVQVILQFTVTKPIFITKLLSTNVF